jgi:hypothetical protein
MQPEAAASNAKSTDAGSVSLSSLQNGFVQVNNAEDSDYASSIFQVNMGPDASDAAAAAPAKPAPAAKPSDTHSDSQPVTAEEWGSCGPLHNAKCPGSQCCSATLGWVCGDADAFCSVEQGCMPSWGSCTPHGGISATATTSKGSSSDAAPESSSSKSTNTSKTAEATPADVSSRWSTGGIVGVASGGAATLAALLGGAYTCWKWWHKRRAIEVRR